MKNQTRELNELINKRIQGGLSELTWILENLAGELGELGYQEEEDSVRQAASYISKTAARLEFRFKGE